MPLPPTFPAHLPRPPSPPTFPAHRSALRRYYGMPANVRFAARMWKARNTPSAPSYPALVALKGTTFSK